METVQLDLISLPSVRAAAKEVAGTTDHVDVLINNAGISTSILRFSPEGVESQFATNHLGAFLLTKLLLPLLLRAGPGARVVNVSSAAHLISPVRFSDINFEDEVVGPKRGKMEVPEEERPPPELPAWTLAPTADGFPGTAAYGQSKTANILFTVALKQRLAGQGIEVLALHPGGMALCFPSLSCLSNFILSALSALERDPGHILLSDPRGCMVPSSWAYFLPSFT